MISDKIILKGTGGSGVTWFKRTYNSVEFNPHTKEMPNIDGTLIYLYTHPLIILQSFDRRGFLGISIGQLQGEKGMEYCKDNGSFDFGELTIDEYIDINIDLFDFENHFEFFKSQPNKKMLIKYEAIHDNLSLIEGFINQKPKSIGVLNKRNSSITKYSTGQLKRLTEIHKDWIEKYNQLPDIITHE